MLHTDNKHNFASQILRQADAHPDRLALCIPRLNRLRRIEGEETATFAELALRVQAFGHGLKNAGFEPGDRLILMFPVSVDLYALTLALFATGMAAILIDIGMGRKQVLRAIRDTRPRGLITVRSIARWRWLLPDLWRCRVYVADAKRHRLSCSGGLIALRSVGPQMPVAQVNPQDEALISFTSGSTGRPKGANRTHGFLRCQHEALEQHFPHRQNDVDCSCFPAMALHTLSCGITTVLPAVDLGRPDSVQPARVIEQLNRYAVTRFGGAPAFMAKICRYIEWHDARARTVREIAVGGAPVSAELGASIIRAFPGAEVHCVYGSTEAEPIASINAAELVQRQGCADGYLLGRAVAGIELKIVTLPQPVPPIDANGLIPWHTELGGTGEIIVSGAHVNRGYLDNAAADRCNKLLEANGKIWHRTRDLGRLDSTGQLWLLGRMGDTVWQRGLEIFPFVVERELNSIAGVAKCALIQVDLGPVLAFQADPSTPVDLPALRTALNRFKLADIPIHTIDRLPMDRRHNSKVDRIALRKHITDLS